MVKQVLFSAWFVVAVAACGGKKAGTTPTDDSSEREQSEADRKQEATEAAMIPPEKIEEIQRILERKQGIMSRCLADAVDAKELPKNSRGKITLDIVISKSGSPDQVKVLKSSLESDKLTSCVVGKVKAMQFPELPASFPTSYTYAFEAM